MNSITIGKLRGLQQISSADGFILVTAMDHREGLRKMMNPSAPETVTDEQMVELKRDLCRSLAPYSTAVLLDPELGAAQSIAAHALPGRIGLLVSLEKSGYTADAYGRRTELLDDWNPAKIRRMGASGAKLLVYYHPDSQDASFQQDLVAQVAEACRKEDLLLVVETIAYPLDSSLDNQSDTFAGQKTEIVVRTAEEITSLGIDIFKAEFPLDKRVTDRGKMLDACRQLDAASKVPWVLLSEGVDFVTFADQVEVACEAGACGFMVGRAAWQEAVTVQPRERRLEVLDLNVVDNLQRLGSLVRLHGRPWHRRLDAGIAALTRNLDSTWGGSPFGRAR